MPMTYLPPMKNRKPTVQREFKGENRLDSFSIGDEFATETKNMTAMDYPALSVRPGYSVLGTYGTKVLGLGAWKDTELHAVFNDGTWRKYSSGAWTTIRSGLSTTAECYFANFQGAFTDINLIMTNGIVALRYSGGTTVQTLLNVPAGANFVTTFQNRLWVAFGREIRSSDLDNAEAWTPDPQDDSKAFGKDLESPYGETINGLYGELSKMTITFPKTLKKLLGSLPSDFNDQPISQTMGIMNNKSAVTIDGVMHLYSAQGFYTYSGGVAPEKSFSLPVQYYADNANTTARSMSAVGTDGQNLYFSLPMDSSTTPDTILEYDRKARAWNAWKDIKATHFLQMGNDFYIGDSQGRVLKLGGTTDGGTAISWHIVSKPFTGGSMSQVIRWLRMWVTVSLPVGSTMTVWLSKSDSGDSDWTEIGTITAASNIQQRSIPVSSMKVPNAKVIRYKISGTGPATIHEVSWEQDQMPLS